MRWVEQHYRKVIASDQNNSMVRHNFMIFLYNQSGFIGAM